MASKTKHYTSVEKKIFLDILKNHKDTIEAKKSDSSTLREKATAWASIAVAYNNSTQINDERTVPQLKKLWTNLKQTQRNALTQEKQASMATGGGPQAPPAEIDPDVAMIAPHLMEVAPSSFSSNVIAEHRNDYLIELSEEQDDEGEIEYLDVQAYLEQPNVLREYAENESDISLTGTSSSNSQATNSGTPSQVSNKTRVAAKRRRTCTESSVQSSSGATIKLDTLKMQRVAVVCKQDDDIFEIKKRHELKVSAMKEAHLSVVNRIKEEHLIKINDLELRKATAEAELAELRLLHERANI